MEAQYTRQHALVGSALVAGALEARLAKLVDFEEVLAAQVFVALGMVGVDRSGVDIDSNTAGFRLGRVIAESAGKFVEAAEHPAIAEMLNLELDKRMGRVDLKISGRRERAERAAQTEHRSGERALGNGVHEVLLVC